MSMTLQLPAAPNAGLILYSTAAAALVGLLLLTNWPTYQYSIRGGIIPLAFYVVPMILSIPIIFAQPGVALRYFREPLVWWFLAFVVSGLVWLLLAQDFIEEASQQWRLRLLAFGIFYAIAILTTSVNRRFIAVVIIACVVIATLANWVDVLRPYRFIPKGIEGAHTGRGAGLFINPNVAGSFIAMATIVALPFVAMRLRAAVLVLALVGIAPTFSRSAFLYAGLLLVAPLVLKLVNRTQAVLLVVMVSVLIIATAASYDLLMSSSDDAQLHNVARRLEWFQGVDESERENAVEGRIYGAQQAWRLFLEQPVVGSGIGITTMEMVVGEGPHNMYLMLAAEQGFFGLLLYVSLIGLVARGGVQLARTALDRVGHETGQAMILFAMFLFLYGFFSHNVFEEAQGMFVLAFLVAAASTASRSVPSTTALTTDFQARRGAANAGSRLGPNR
jgi:O-antigen ligase